MELKKTPNADLSTKTGLFFNLGLMISISLALFAFNYKVYDASATITTLQPNNIDDELLDIPITIQETTPPPPLEQPIIQEVPDEIQIEDLVFVIDIDVKDDVVIKDIVISDAPIIDDAEEIFDFVESAPSPIGGMSAWNQYLKKNLKYPTQARRMGIEGTVTLVFVVNTDGSLQDIEILRGLDGGCNEEAIRVIKNAPKWEPGKQRGKPVRARMRMPIRFKLG
ncbi:energy transducer TonB [Belliella marina]|uniref:Energy transducer TonB n=1 Tax=Belliella marina TaxID=1644146 RepID=A0ABW4VWE8_9BACT